jgi:hypothetical protein
MLVAVCLQIAGFNGLSDAFKRLDFRSAVHDVRRFNYICKLLDLLITQKLTMLSGCAQKVLFNMLEEVAYQGAFPCTVGAVCHVAGLITFHTAGVLHSTADLNECKSYK